MANTIIEKSSYIKWPVSGGMGFGKVIDVKEKNCVIETPSGQVIDVLNDVIIASTEEEYEASLDDLINHLSKKPKSRKNKVKEAIASVTNEGKENMNDATASCNCAAELEAMKKDCAAMKEKCEATEAMKTELASKAQAAESEAKTMKDEMEKWRKAAEEATSKVADMQKASLAQVRFTQLKDVNAIEMIAKSNDEAINKLGNMTSEAFDMVLSVATASFKKLTDQTQTNLPKLTDQTQTNKPKLTDQTQASDNALENAEKEQEVTAETIASASDNLDILSKFANATVGKLAKNK